MNTLIIESGATKTDWVIVGENEYYLPRTVGLNPYHINSNQIEATVEQQRLLSKVKIERIYFYGSGYRAESAKISIGNILLKYFKPVQIQIYDDIQALVHSFKLKNGLGLILGTGSNACQVVAGRITKQMRSSGFLLGDEGSASYLAKYLLKDYIEDILPQDLAYTFEHQYGLDRRTCLALFYNYPIDKAAISQYAKFIKTYIRRDYMQNLVLGSFKSFLSRLKQQNFELKQTPCYCVGSVGSTFQNLLGQALKEEEALLLKVVKTPLQGLIKWVQGTPN